MVNKNAKVKTPVLLSITHSKTYLPNNETHTDHSNTVTVLIQKPKRVQ